MTDLTVPTINSGVVPTATWNQIAAVMAFLVNPPRFVGRQSVAQAIANTTWTALTLDVEDIDTYNGHSTSVNTSRYTPTQPGWYCLIAQASFVVNATGYRVLQIEKNGSTNDRYGRTSQPGSASAQALSTSTYLYLNGTTDYVEVYVYQSSGGALNTTVADDGAPGSNPALRAFFAGSSAS